MITNDRFKMRYWDKQINKMRYGDIHMAYNGKPFVICMDKDVTPVQYIDDVIPMQCADIKDKNNKLIFEGDWVVFPHGDTKRIGAVVYSKTLWMVTNSNFCQGAWCGGALINMYRNCEIIGNIYENKNLAELRQRKVIR